ncbi:aflatoxin-detoxifizyme [Fomitopsis serialis]|uniref:aflatoxin-detoxifizyme n=1 Tax=Fomitopsis serialis TaxID=139415 RepID=UPI002007D5AC|nr:aflatoxin-detoxifizyme [Neoantrodia serialis]KAH9934742.1 aflatoxin-detoxifizyme [Neoantrodia serialis]
MSMSKPAKSLLRDSRRTAAEAWSLMGILVERTRAAGSAEKALECYERALGWAGVAADRAGGIGRAGDGTLESEWKALWETIPFPGDRSAPLCSLDVAKSFAQLTSKEKKYAHHIGQASWAGARIIQGQWTPQAQKLYDLLILTFSDKEGLRTSLAYSRNLMQYTTQVLSNLVNYKSFGFTKIVPRIPEAKFAAVVEKSANAPEALSLWNELKGHIYRLLPESSNFIGKRREGHVSNYYPGEPILDDEVAAIQATAESSVSTPSVRKDGPDSFALLVASANPKPASLHEIEVVGKGVQLTVEYAVAALKEAKKYVANDHQAAMLDGYIESYFETGSIEAHKKGSTEWVKDVGPVVENYIGFIETYVDPYGGRAEWEGFTAIVNKAMSAKYDTLVSKAPELLEVLPWGKDFEVDNAGILTFATGGKNPAGINNYYEIREANILAAKAPNEELTFIHPDDLQVANHELLGHGSGKLFQENADGTKNFDPSKITNPLTGKPITSWYKPGQTPGSVLGEVSSSMEECRAETVALYLVSEPEILKIFKYTEKKDVEDVQYITFLLMARAGLRALEFYDPATKKHGQAHMQARLGITQHLIKSGIARLEEIRSADGTLENLYIRVDKEKVLTHGREVAGTLLVELQVRKSTADGPGARAYYTELTTPSPAGRARFETWFSRRSWYVPAAGYQTHCLTPVGRYSQPRKIFVQPNTFIEKDEVVLKEYPLTPAGVIESFIERRL